MNRQASRTGVRRPKGVKMFIYEKCSPKYKIGEFEKLFGPRSYGPCESCGEIASCVDHHGRRTPDAGDVAKGCPKCGSLLFENGACQACLYGTPRA